MAHSQAEVFEDRFPLIQSCPALNEIRLAQDIKELRIEVHDGNVLHAHRIVLAARIPYLRGALSDLLGEGTSVLRWPMVPLSLATALVQYVYTGQVEMTQSNVKGMVVLARMLKIPSLINWGVEFMANRVSLENLPATWDFARSLNVKLLAEKCIGLMRAHFEDIVPTELFVRLPAGTVLGLLRSEDLSVASEEQVIAAVARWAGADDEAADDADEKLKLHTPAMLKEVQWHLTSIQCRDRVKEGYPILQKSSECLRLILQVEHWIGASDKDKSPCPFNLRPRNTSSHFGADIDQTVFLFGANKNRDGFSALRVDPQHQQAEGVADMKEPRYASYSVVGESIFVVGGGVFGSMSDVDEFLVRDGRWHERARLTSGRGCHAAAVVKVPAAAAAAATKKVGQDRWHKLPSLPEARTSPAAACLPGDSRIFIFGGFDGSSGLASVIFCHLRADWRKKAISARTADFWQPVAPMRTARHARAATPFRGAILVAGGFDGKSSLSVVEMFTPPDARSPSGQWTQLADMNQPRSGFILLPSANAVIALGNKFAGDDDQTKNSVETLTGPGGSDDWGTNLTTWIWSSKSPVKTLYQIHGAACLRM
ncbi:protein homodimerization activity [Sparganum proliferum]